MLEILVGLNVEDSEVYQKYREKMGPLLKNLGGYFRYDFTIAQTLKSETEETINRIFVICFPDLKSKERFFSSKEYKKIQQQYFERSVKNTTMIAEYER